MRVAHITPGAGGMLCGACLHDNTLVGALQGEGLDVALLPVYTPLRTDERDFSSDRVFFGALNVFLEERSSLYRRLPAAVTRLLDSRPLLRLLSRFDATIDGRRLGQLAVSMLQGEHGHQARDLDELVRWLKTGFKPHLIHLSNSLLLGLARRLRHDLGVPVICSLQGEEIFMEELPTAYRQQVQDLMQGRAGDVAAFISPCNRYARFMADLLNVPPQLIHHVPLGLNMEGHGEDRPSRPETPLVIGYLARICPEKGLHLLLEAFLELAGSLPAGAVELHVAGYQGRRDETYTRALKHKVGSSPFASQVRFFGELDRQEKIAFLRGLDILSVPTPYREPKGLFVLEALANGTPVVQPDHGAFPAMLQATGGGILFRHGDAADLLRALRELGEDPSRRRQLGEAGRRAVASSLTDRHMARGTMAVYHQVLQAQAGGKKPAGEGS